MYLSTPLLPVWLQFLPSHLRHVVSYWWNPFDRKTTTHQNRLQVFNLYHLAHASCSLQARTSRLPDRDFHISALPVIWFWPPDVKWPVTYNALHKQTNKQTHIASVHSKTAISELCVHCGHIFIGPLTVFILFFEKQWKTERNVVN